MNNLISALGDRLRSLALPESLAFPTALRESEGKQLASSLSKYGGRLTCLSLSKALVNLSTRTIIAILAAIKKHCKNLRELHLNDNGLHLPEEIELLEAVLETHGGTLIALSLGGNDFGPEGSVKVLTALIDSTNANPRLERLDLSGFANSRDTEKLLRDLNVNIMEPLKTLNVSNWLPKRLDMTQGALKVLVEYNDVQVELGEDESEEEDDDDKEEEEAFGGVSNLPVFGGAKETEDDSLTDSGVSNRWRCVNEQYSEQQFGLVGRPGYFANPPDSQALYNSRSANSSPEDTYDLNDYEIISGN